MSEARPCKRCGMVIEFREGPNGKAIPLQRVRTVYALDPNGEHLQNLTEHLREEAAQIGEPTASAYFVSHFETCPHADEFTKRSKT